MTQNILDTIASSDLPFGARPFPLLQSEDYVPAIEACLETARQEFATIKDSPEPATFTNTLEAMEFMGQDLGKVSTIFFNLLHACTNDTLDGAAPEISQKLAAFANDLQLDPKLFARVKAVYDNRTTLNLNDQQSLLLDEAYKDFVLNGALLDETQKETLRKIDGELAQIGPEYGQNLLKSTNAFHMNVDNKELVAHLPASAQASAAEEAKKRDQQGWTFTLNAPSVMPFLKYMPDRGLRKKLWLAYNQKAYTGEHSNLSLIHI